VYAFTKNSGCLYTFRSIGELRGELSLHRSAKSGA
jgi:hypothetical protein